MTIDFKEAARRIAKARREKIFAALGDVELAPEERTFVCTTAWEGHSEALVSLIEKVREAANAGQEELISAVAVAAATFEFNPANEESKNAIVAAIHRERRKIDRAGWPGLPIGWLPVRDAPSMHELIDEGRIELVTVTKQSNAVPGKRMQYGYVRIAKS